FSSKMLGTPMTFSWALIVLTLAASSVEHSVDALSITKAFTKIGERFYYIEEQEQQSWYTALSTCRQMGAHLATLKSEKELYDLDAELRIRNQGYWIDVNDLDREGQFVSWTTSSPSPYLKWKAGEPNNLYNKEHCVDIWDGLMNDDDCSDKRYFICQ
ncbi:hypothetical protein KR026_009019, partial [Drosophila bipectinata]